MLNKDTLDTSHNNLTGKFVCSLFHQISQEWIVVSGATHHVAESKNILSKYYKVDGSKKDKIHLSTGAKVDISHTGEAHMFRDGTVKDVLFVPDFKLNLLLVSKMTRQLSCFVSFHPYFYVCQDLHNGRVKGIGKETGGLYVLKRQYVEHKVQSSRAQVHKYTAEA